MATMERVLLGVRGMDTEAAREAVESIVVSYPFVAFVDRAAYAEARTSTVDTVLRFVLAPTSFTPPTVPFAVVLLAATYMVLEFAFR